jgi:hypothetical protein
MSTPSQLTTTPNPTFAGLQSTQDYYERFRNPNLFISNNANPFLISPYAPNQLSQTTANAIVSTNTIKPLTPGGTIQIQGDVNVAAPYQLSLDGNPLRTDRIYAGVSLGTPAQIICSTTPDIQVELAGTTNVLFETASTKFQTAAAPGAYSLFVDGTISTAAIAVTTAAGAAPGGAPVASLPITVGGVAYNLALY